MVDGPEVESAGGASRSGVYLLFVGLPSASVRRCAVCALLPEMPVDATARTFRWPFLSATRLVIFASFTFSVLETPGARL